MKPISLCSECETNAWCGETHFPTWCARLCLESFKNDRSQIGPSIYGFEIPVGTIWDCDLYLTLILSLVGSANAPGANLDPSSSGDFYGTDMTRITSLRMKRSYNDAQFNTLRIQRARSDCGNGRKHQMGVFVRACYKHIRIQ